VRVRGPRERRSARALEVLDQLQVTAVADRAAEIRRERQVRSGVATVQHLVVRWCIDAGRLAGAEHPRGSPEARG